MKTLTLAFIFSFNPDVGLTCKDYDFKNAIEMIINGEKVKQVCVSRKSKLPTGFFSWSEWKKIRGDK